MLRIVLILGLLWFCPAPARAQVFTLGSWGSWTAFGGVQQDGQRVCGIAVRGDGRSVHLRQIAGQPQVEIELFRRGWEIAQREPVAFSLQPGRYETAVLQGFALPREGLVPPRIAALLRYDASRPFWAALRSADILRVNFAAGPERSWVVATPGSAGAVAAIAECLRRMGAPMGPFEDPPRRN